MWLATVSGLIAGGLFGVVAHFGLGVMGTVGAIFLLGSSAVAGWAVHAVLSAAFGALWGVITEYEAISEYTRNPTTGMTLGAVYGFALWFVNVGLLLPIWATNVLGLYTPFPYLLETGAMMPLLGHLLWGAILGFVYPVMRY